MNNRESGFQLIPIAARITVKTSERQKYIKVNLITIGIDKHMNLEMKYFASPRLFVR